jgi:hypothetical protein
MATIRIIWSVTPCNLVYKCYHFGETILRREAASSSLQWHLSVKLHGVIYQFGVAVTL